MNIRKYVNSVITPQRAYELCFGTLPPSGKCMCPFHDNTRTPAAKVYDYGLRCYGSCNRVYTSYDMLSRFNPDYLSKLAQTQLPPVATKPRVSLPPKFF